MRSIVVGVDESAGAAAALRWAAAERAIHDCTLTAVLCWTYLEQHRGTPGQPFDPEYSEEDAREALDAIVERALGEGAGVVERRTVNDHTARGLLDASADADLLVLGARGLGLWKSLTLGSVTRQCLHHSKVPVAVIRHDVEVAGPDGTMPVATNRIVVGIDGSEPSKRALAWAIDEARQRGAGTTVAAVHSWMPPYVGAELVPAMAYDTAEFERIGRTLLDAAVDEVDTSGDVPIERLVMTGPAATVLLDAADHADLLVVGSRGLGGFKELLFGSVSTYVTNHARCPVIVIPRVG